LIFSDYISVIIIVTASLLCTLAYKQTKSNVLESFSFKSWADGILLSVVFYHLAKAISVTLGNFTLLILASSSIVVSILVKKITQKAKTNAVYTVYASVIVGYVLLFPGTYIKIPFIDIIKYLWIFLLLIPTLFLKLKQANSFLIGGSLSMILLSFMFPLLIESNYLIFLVTLGVLLSTWLIQWIFRRSL
jgi:hypothetical protein